MSKNTQDIQKQFLLKVSNDEKFIQYLKKHFDLFKTMERVIHGEVSNTLIEHWILSISVDTLHSDMNYDKFRAIELNFLRELYEKYEKDQK